MIREIFETAFNPESPDFYEAITVVILIATSIASVFKFGTNLVLGKRICNSTKIVINCGIQQHLYWVKSQGESQLVDGLSLKEWLINHSGFAFVGERHKLFNNS